MNRGELVEWIAERAKEFRPDAIPSINRNSHMNALAGKCEITQPEADALLVSFVNFCGLYLGIDYAMYTVDLEQPPKGAPSDAG